MFGGVDVAPTDVLVKFTHLGDTDLDGDVDSAGLSNILMGINNPSTYSGWNWGDVNYDGVVDSFDPGRAIAVINSGLSPLGRGEAGEVQALTIEDVMDPDLDWSRVGTVGRYEDEFTGVGVDLAPGPVVGVILEPMGAGVVMGGGVMLLGRRRKAGGR